uniref:C2 domain-containing protein n=1 Tax=Chromera velia CCMP2878 TaxID=1169474 RepID=A0A0G4GHI3_9ALVE|eukprot:Cvel_663.t1-p1 / transcript=Cvel_663.t1 / gene=Cvel_663 / organism=Chromera_velia_CCMP2878 / gene_product=hypothetical protein / transcript_product=hypothetical protein / location=Cvel_scaffold20:124494-149483(+) / protein_length=3868 / sequence_SO=supercontig / SO=protein_coding / is_pseudo=false
MPFLTNPLGGGFLWKLNDVGKTAGALFKSDPKETKKAESILVTSARGDKGNAQELSSKVRVHKETYGPFGMCVNPIIEEEVDVIEKDIHAPKLWLRLGILSASDLPTMDTVKSDPYVVAHFQGNNHKTAYISKSLNPVWNEVWEVPFKGNAGEVKLSLYDYDLLFKDDLMGSASLPVTKSDRRVQRSILTLSSRPDTDAAESKLLLIHHVTDSLENQPDLVQIAQNLATGAQAGGEDQKDWVVSVNLHDLKLFQAQEKTVLFPEITVGDQKSGETVVGDPQVPTDGYVVRYGDGGAGGWNRQFFLSARRSGFVSLRLKIRILGASVKVLSEANKNRRRAAALETRQTRTRERLKMRRDQIEMKRQAVELSKQERARKRSEKAAEKQKGGEGAAAGGDMPVENRIEEAAAAVLQTVTGHGPPPAGTSPARASSAPPRSRVSPPRGAAGVGLEDEEDLEVGKLKPIAEGDEEEEKEETFQTKVPTRTEAWERSLSKAVSKDEEAVQVVGEWEETLDFFMEEIEETQTAVGVSALLFKVIANTGSLKMQVDIHEDGDAANSPFDMNVAPPTRRGLAESAKRQKEGGAIMPKNFYLFAYADCLPPINAAGSMFGTPFGFSDWKSCSPFLRVKAFGRMRQTQTMSRQQRRIVWEPITIRGTTQKRVRVDLELCHEPFSLNPLAEAKVFARKTFFAIRPEKQMWFHLFGGALSSSRPDVSEGMLKGSVFPPSTYKGSVCLSWDSRLPNEKKLWPPHRNTSCMRLEVRLFRGLYIKDEKYRNKDVFVVVHMAGCVVPRRGAIKRNTQSRQKEMQQRRDDERRKKRMRGLLAEVDDEYYPQDYTPHLLTFPGHVNEKGVLRFYATPPEDPPTPKRQPTRRATSRQTLKQDSGVLSVISSEQPLPTIQGGEGPQAATLGRRVPFEGLRAAPPKPKPRGGVLVDDSDDGESVSVTLPSHLSFPRKPPVPSGSPDGDGDGPRSSGIDRSRNNNGNGNSRQDTPNQPTRPGTAPASSGQARELQGDWSGPVTPDTATAVHPGDTDVANWIRTLSADEIDAMLRVETGATTDQAASSAYPTSRAPAPISAPVAVHASVPPSPKSLVDSLEKGEADVEEGMGAAEAPRLSHSGLHSMMHPGDGLENRETFGDVPEPSEDEGEYDGVEDPLLVPGDENVILSAFPVSEHEEEAETRESTEPELQKKKTKRGGWFSSGPINDPHEEGQRTAWVQRTTLAIDVLPGVEWAYLYIQLKNDPDSTPEVFGRIRLEGGKTPDPMEAAGVARRQQGTGADSDSEESGEGSDAETSDDEGPGWLWPDGTPVPRWHPLYFDRSVRKEPKAFFPSPFAGCVLGWARCVPVDEERKLALPPAERDEKLVIRALSRAIREEREKLLATMAPENRAAFPETPSAFMSHASFPNPQSELAPTDLPLTMHGGGQGTLFSAHKAEPPVEDWPDTASQFKRLAQLVSLKEKAERNRSFLRFFLGPSAAEKAQKQAEKEMEDRIKRMKDREREMNRALRSGLADEGPVLFERENPAYVQTVYLHCDFLQARNLPPMDDDGQTDATWEILVEDNSATPLPSQIPKSCNPTFLHRCAIPVQLYLPPSSERRVVTVGSVPESPLVGASGKGGDLPYPLPPLLLQMKDRDPLMFSSMLGRSDEEVIGTSVDWTPRVLDEGKAFADLATAPRGTTRLVNKQHTPVWHILTTAVDAPVGLLEVERHPQWKKEPRVLCATGWSCLPPPPVSLESFKGNDPNESPAAMETLSMALRRHVTLVDEDAKRVQEKEQLWWHERRENERIEKGMRVGVGPVIPDSPDGLRYFRFKVDLLAVRKPRGTVVSAVERERPTLQMSTWGSTVDVSISDLGLPEQLIFKGDLPSRAVFQPIRDAVKLGNVLRCSYIKRPAPVSPLLLDMRRLSGVFELYKQHESARHLINARFGPKVRVLLDHMLKRHEHMKKGGRNKRKRKNRARGSRSERRGDGGDGEDEMEGSDEDIDEENLSQDPGRAAIEDFLDEIHTMFTPFARAASESLNIQRAALPPPEAPPRVVPLAGGAGPAADVISRRGGDVVSQGGRRESESRVPGQAAKSHVSKAKDARSVAAKTLRRLSTGSAAGQQKQGGKYHSVCVPAKSPSPGTIMGVRVELPIFCSPDLPYLRQAAQGETKTKELQQVLKESGVKDASTDLDLFGAAGVDWEVLRHHLLGASDRRGKTARAKAEAMGPQLMWAKAGLLLPDITFRMKTDRDGWIWGTLNRDMATLSLSLQPFLRDPSAFDPVFVPASPEEVAIISASTGMAALPTPMAPKEIAGVGEVKPLFPMIEKLLADRKETEEAIVSAHATGVTLPFDGGIMDRSRWGLGGPSPPRTLPSPTRPKSLLPAARFPKSEAATPAPGSPKRRNSGDRAPPQLRVSPPRVTVLDPPPVPAAGALSPPEGAAGVGLLSPPMAALRKRQQDFRALQMPHQDDPLQMNSPGKQTAISSLGPPISQRVRLDDGVSVAPSAPAGPLGVGGFGFGGPGGDMGPGGRDANADRWKRLLVKRFPGVYEVNIDIFSEVEGELIYDTDVHMGRLIRDHDLFHIVDVGGRMETFYLNAGDYFLNNRDEAHAPFENPILRCNPHDDGTSFPHEIPDVDVDGSAADMPVDRESMQVGGRELQSMTPSVFAAELTGVDREEGQAPDGTVYSVQTHKSGKKLVLHGRRDVEWERENILVGHSPGRRTRRSGRANEGKERAPQPTETLGNFPAMVPTTPQARDARSFFRRFLTAYEAPAASARGGSDGPRVRFADAQGRAPHGVASPTVRSPGASVAGAPEPSRFTSGGRAQSGFSVAPAGFHQAPVTAPPSIHEEKARQLALPSSVLRPLEVTQRLGFFSYEFNRAFVRPLGHVISDQFPASKIIARLQMVVRDPSDPRLQRETFNFVCLKARVDGQIVWRSNARDFLAAGEPICVIRSAEDQTLYPVLVPSLDLRLMRENGYYVRRMLTKRWKDVENRAMEAEQMRQEILRQKGVRLALRSEKKKGAKAQVRNEKEKEIKLDFNYDKSSQTQKFGKVLQELFVGSEAVDGHDLPIPVRRGQFVLRLQRLPNRQFMDRPHSGPFVGRGAASLLFPATLSQAAALEGNADSSEVGISWFDAMGVERVINLRHCLEWGGSKGREEKGTLKAAVAVSSYTPREFGAEVRRRARVLRAAELHCLREKGEEEELEGGEVQREEKDEERIEELELEVVTRMKEGGPRAASLSVRSFDPLDIMERHEEEGAVWHCPLDRLWIPEKIRVFVYVLTLSELTTHQGPVEEMKFEKEDELCLKVSLGNAEELNRSPLKMNKSLSSRPGHWNVYEQYLFEISVPGEALLRFDVCQGENNKEGQLGFLEVDLEDRWLALKKGQQTVKPQERGEGLLLPPICSSPIETQPLRKRTYGARTPQEAVISTAGPSVTNKEAPFVESGWIRFFVDMVPDEGWDARENQKLAVTKKGKKKGKGKSRDGQSSVGTAMTGKGAGAGISPSEKLYYERLTESLLYDEIPVEIVTGDKMYELRAVCWDVTNVTVFKDAVRRRNDLTVELTLRVTDEMGRVTMLTERTDTHNFACTEASFNWRFLFPVSLPSSHVALECKLIDVDKLGTDELIYPPEVVELDHVCRLATVQANKAAVSQSLGARALEETTEELLPYLPFAVRFSPPPNTPLDLGSVGACFRTFWCVLREFFCCCFESCFDDIDAKLQTQHQEDLEANPDVPQIDDMEDEKKRQRKKEEKKRWWTVGKRSLGLHKVRRPPLNRAAILHLEVQIVPDVFAANDVLGKGREQPNRNPYLPPPNGRIEWSQLFKQPVTFIKMLMGPDNFNFLKFMTCSILFITFIAVLAIALSSLIQAGAAAGSGANAGTDAAGTGGDTTGA